MTKNTAKTDSQKSSKRTIRHLLPVTKKGRALCLAYAAIGVAPFVYVTTIYKGDTYCKDLISEGVQVDCSPEVASSMYLLSAVLWLISSMMLLYTIQANKDKLVVARRAKKSRKQHAKKS